MPTDPPATRPGDQRAGFVLSRTASVLASAIALAALSGWALDSVHLRALSPTLTPMNPATAVGFVLAALALWVAADENAVPARRTFARVLGTVVAVIGLARLAGYVAGSEVWFDRVLFASRLEAAPGGPNRIAPNTALCFAFLGAALSLVDVRDRHGRRPAEYVVLPAAFVSLLGLVGYLYRARGFYGVGPYVNMALNTAAAFQVLCVGVLAARPSAAGLRRLLEPGGGGQSARRLLPAVIVIPVVLGWLRLQGERAGLYDTGFGVALTTVATVAFLVAVIWWDARRISRAEAALRQSESTLSQVLEALPVAVFVTDGRGRPLYANALSTQLLGRGIVPEASAGTLPEVYSARIAGTDQPYPGDRQPIVAALGGERGHAADMEIRRPDAVVPIEVWAAPVRDAEGRVAYAIAAFSDISERRRAEEEERRLRQQLQRAVAELEAVNKELEAFSYSVSHDLRAPLRHIAGFSEFLERDAEALGEKGRRHVATIRSAAARMGQLVDDLLAFSRLGRGPLATTDVELGPVVESVIAELRRDVGARDVAWTAGPLPAVRGDAALLRVALMNLLANALKFTALRPRAEIAVGTAGGGEPGEMVVFVRDNGVGFDPRYAGKLFDVFQRLHDREQFEGTGIGLATVRRIAHRLGGRVWAEGAVNQGATVFIALPAA